MYNRCRVMYFHSTLGKVSMIEQFLSVEIWFNVFGTCASLFFFLSKYSSTTHKCMHLYK